ncbi:MAG: aminomethyl-transferring glycine dehydrogenase subunit GcvPA [Candidatus Omnitrophica bacterium]|nr:aminomethyl-transferring glycine dehydrogenase subunit GcvPA [Candidatus Omnitrophota bacterium]
MSYASLTDHDRKVMLQEIGVTDFEELCAAIPRQLRNPVIKLPHPLSELELRTMVRSLAHQNKSTDTVLSFIGAGAYEHFIPSVVHHVTSRSEFYTAYTPYQAEASQGTLQAMYEYQSMMCTLTGMDVSNASHYDGATSMAEAALVSMSVKKRKKVIVASSVHPEYRQVLKTYLRGTAGECIEIPFTSEGMLDSSRFKTALHEDVACCIVQSPNFFGIVENFSEIEKLIHACGAHFIIVANPLSLARFKSPGEWNADIACGEAQVFGNPLSFGGPYLGYFAVKKELMRKIPGRLVGLSHDSEGRRMFTLTLQTREQHIRRERATSNICSNQALCALAAGVYLTTLGKEGLRQVADLNIQNANYLREAFTSVLECEITFTGPIFNEFVIRINKDVEKIIAALLKKGIYAGLSLQRFYPKLKNELLVCATETKTKEDLDRFVKEFSLAVSS